MSESYPFLMVLLNHEDPMFFGYIVLQNATLETIHGQEMMRGDCIIKNAEYHFLDNKKVNIPFKSISSFVELNSIKEVPDYYDNPQNREPR